MKFIINTSCTQRTFLLLLNSLAFLIYHYRTTNDRSSAYLYQNLSEINVYLVLNLCLSVKCLIVSLTKL